MDNKKLRRMKRHQKIRVKIIGTRACPRLSVFKSNKYIYAQLIDDTEGIILASSTDLKLKKRGKKTENAFEVGKTLAQKAEKLKIKKVVFDRGGYPYHGRVKSLAEGAKKGGLIF